jgi:hypothetical protein
MAQLGAIPKEQFQAHVCGGNQWQDQRERLDQGVKECVSYWHNWLLSLIGAPLGKFSCDLLESS